MTQQVRSRPTVLRFGIADARMHQHEVQSLQVNAEDIGRAALPNLSTLETAH
jgi:hypothetical protein